MLKRLFFLILISVLLFACRKNKDESLPVIDITIPYSNQIFSALDTITISATIEDETFLEQIRICVCDENKIPVLSTISISPQDRKVSLQIPYALDDIGLASGMYYIWIRASDGINTANKYRSIQITAVERELKYVYIMSIFNSTTIRMERKSSTGNLESVSDINGDLSSTASSSTFQTVATCGSTYGDLILLDVSSGLTKWSLPVASNPPFPYFKYMCGYNNIFYVSFYDGYIKGFNNTGLQVFAANSPAGTYPDRIAVTSNYVFADQGTYSGSERYFNLYYNNTGVLKQQISTDYNITNIFQKDDDNIFLFANNNAGQGVIKLYSISANGTWEPHTLPSGTINDVTQIDEETYIIAHENGLYKYQYDINSLTVYVNGLNAQKIKFDDLSSEVYAAHNNTLDIYDYSSHSLKSSISTSDSIAGFELLYNK